MTSISYCEARTHFSELLDQVAKGKKILITRRGRPAAMLSPPDSPQKRNYQDVIREMKNLRRGNRLGTNLSIRDLIDEGRR
jgi:prevent-host-death family protein